MRNTRKREIIKFKHSQEEMVGFVLIIVLVSIVALVFFAVSIARQPRQEYRSSEISNFLGLFLQYTTGCEIRYLPASMKDIIEECANNKMCDDGESACDAMAYAAENALNDSWHYGNESYLRGYEFNITLTMNVTGAAGEARRETIQQLSELNRGNCNVAVKRAADVMLPMEDKDIVISLKACYAG